LRAHRRRQQQAFRPKYHRLATGHIADLVPFNFFLRPVNIVGQLFQVAANVAALEGIYMFFFANHELNWGE